MKNRFLAKTNPIETIEEHTLNLVKEMRRIKEFYPNINYLDWDILYYACVFHDFGKLNCKFQNKLIKKLIGKSEFTEQDILKDPNPKIEEFQHGYLSCAFIPEEYFLENFSKEDLCILYQSIYYHHVRPAITEDDEEDLEKIIDMDLSRYDEKFVKVMSRKFAFPYDDLNSDYLVDILGSSRIVEDKGDIFLKYIITKGLLNKLDYAASGHVDVEVRNSGLYEKTFKSFEVGGFKTNDLQSFMIDNKDKNIVAIASTGIGKTEGALFWIGNNKGFFTLPLKVSINAIYDRVRDKIGFKEVALLHSDTYSEYLKRNNNNLDIDYYDKTKQLSMPLTICTLDQLIDFIFKYEGFEIKLATLSYSKLVIDEIQMYSPNFVAYLIVALYYINKVGGKFAIVTATLPEVITDFMEKLNIPFIKPEPFIKKNKDGSNMLRHKITTFQEDINLKHLINNYKEKKILIIVNTVKQAQKLYDEILKINLEYNVKLFHSRFIKKHRSKKEKEIFDMGQLGCKDTGIWITTQVVEASLDIDFDVLYTELSDVSGLFQRMGRVYRNRNLDPDGDTNIYVYLGKDKPTSGIQDSDRSIIDIDIFKLSKEALKDIKDKTIDEKEKMNIVSEVYSVSNLTNSNYYKSIKKTINWALDIPEYSLKKNEERLRNITNITIIPKVIFDENKNEIEQWIECINKPIPQNISKEDVLSIKAGKHLAGNSIRKLTVDITESIYKKAEQSDKIRFYLEVSKFESIPIIDLKYSYELGLDSREIKKEANDYIL